MPDSPSIPPASEPFANGQTLLKGYPAGTLEAATDFARTRDPAALARALAGVLRHHQPPPAGPTPRPDPATAGPDALLTTDLGIDSLAMVEMTFLLQDLWGVTFTDEELRAIDTLGALQTAILGKFSA